MIENGACLQPLVHICFVCGEYPPSPHGGIGTFTQTVAREYVRLGCRVTVVGGYPIDHGSREEDQGVRVIRLSSRGFPLLRLMSNRRRVASAIREIHEQHPIDIMEGGEVDVGMLNRESPGRKVLRMHGGPHFFAESAGIHPGRVYAWKERWAFKTADNLCAVSHYVADTTRRLLKLGDRPIPVIPNPVDLTTFAPAPDDVEEDGLIVFTGTVTERKGIRQLVQAMPRIVSEVPHARLEVYGGNALNMPGAEAYTAALLTSVSPDIAPRIAWKGRVQRDIVRRALQRASVCVYPSHMEAMPIGWLEGLATGKAVVGSKTGPGPEVISHGQDGLLCDPYDPDSIATEIIRALKDSDLRQSLGAAARRHCVERYSLPALIERNLEYYRTILGQAS
jgi:glycosyltransferase involved in cell wall biosynthesis